MSEFIYVVQSCQVRGERRAYWIEERYPNRPALQRHPRCVEDFGTNKRRAERRCAELNAALSLSRADGGAK